ncbi:hypothetical protein [Chitinophaga sancti]|uniref:Uncharacterized protein n=1 Tax=Chitinophaga sancti TaxID=1004 RepID=A0A1K1SZK6_9BACT|nr:hypothetical protein [Chitinophaga sancti]WQD65388.1 hypothetical protein U0033_13385 [Chitinophaga sancti]WQG88988.1 hypothetical protein SR876_29085 [Chitinophaga sancti]SFW89784.1 hypothetical protein SAMN05661012_06488 [Chitinophaga sancti]
MTEGKNFSQQGIEFDQTTISNEFSSFVWKAVLKDASFLEWLNFWEALYRSDRTLDAITTIINQYIPYGDNELLSLWRLHQKWQKTTSVDRIKEILGASISESRSRFQFQLKDEKDDDQQNKIIKKYTGMRNGYLLISISGEIDINDLNGIIADSGRFYKELMNVHMMAAHGVSLDRYRIYKNTYTWLCAEGVDKVYGDLHIEMKQQKGGYRIHVQGKHFILNKLKTMIGSVPGCYPADAAETSLLKLQLAQWFIPLSVTFRAIGFTANEPNSFCESFLPFARKVITHAYEIELFRIK